MQTMETKNAPFKFFWYEAVEEKLYFQNFRIFLCGKTYDANLRKYVSCCLVIKNSQRRIYLLPRTHFKNDPTRPVKLVDVYKEFRDTVAADQRLEVFQSRTVTKKYINHPEIPASAEYLEVRYPAKSRPLANRKGNTYSKVLGANTSLLEILFQECKIKGPCWLEVTNPQRPEKWSGRCKCEVECDGIAGISVFDCNVSVPLDVATLSYKTVMVVDKNVSESVVCMVACSVFRGCSLGNAYPEKQTDLCIFTVPKGCHLPSGFREAARGYAGGQIVKENCEGTVLNCLIELFTQVDPDIVVAHDIPKFFNLLFSKFRKYEALPHDGLSRLKSWKLPPEHIFQREAMSGRLLCDVKVLAAETVRTHSFDMPTLVEEVLNSKPQRPQSEHILDMYTDIDMLLNFVTCTIQESVDMFRVMHKLNVLPLALQITKICGNLLSQTLAGDKTNRCEFLLLHALHERGYLVPDKVFRCDKFEAEKTKSAPSYSGGLVLEPKVGLYKTLTLYMDFTSLYPSIIQEYNVCFSTFAVDGENVVSAQENTDVGILPSILKELVEKRQKIKKVMKITAIDSSLYLHHDIWQSALKLISNSLYGYLAYVHSRFYAKHLAEHITMRGREILVRTVELVETLGFNVVYGDTDSVMVSTNCLDYDEVLEVADRIKAEVNGHYRYVNLEIESVFKYLLLLKKKRYASISVAKVGGELQMSYVYKGLDVVRRDWSEISREAGKDVLKHILSDLSDGERNRQILAYLSKLREDIVNNCVDENKYVIMKQLMKQIRHYSNPDAIPHVRVALKLLKTPRELRLGDIVRYVVCKDGTSLPPLQRVYHIDELKHCAALAIDTDYYLAKQILPVISRLCEPICDIEAHQLASCLEVDPSNDEEFTRTSQEVTEDPSLQKRTASKYSPFAYRCLSCKQQNDVPDTISSADFLKRCANKRCPYRPIRNLSYLCNQLTLNLRSFVGKYHLKAMTCSNLSCAITTRHRAMRFVEGVPVCPHCNNGLLSREYPLKDLVGQLMYFRNMFSANSGQSHPRINAAYVTLGGLVESTLSRYDKVDLGCLFEFLVPKETGKSVYIQLDDDEALD